MTCKLLCSVLAALASFAALAPEPGGRPLSAEEMLAVRGAQSSHIVNHDCILKLAQYHCDDASGRTSCTKPGICVACSPGDSAMLLFLKACSYVKEERCVFDEDHKDKDTREFDCGQKYTGVCKKISLTNPTTGQSQDYWICDMQGKVPQDCHDLTMAHCKS